MGGLTRGGKTEHEWNASSQQQPAFIAPSITYASLHALHDQASRVVSNAPPQWLIRFCRPATLSSAGMDPH